MIEPTKHSVNCYYPHLKKCMSVTSATVMSDMVKTPTAISWTIYMQPTPTSNQLTCKEITPGCNPCAMQITRSKIYLTRSKMPSSMQQQGILPIPPGKWSLLPSRSSFKHASSLRTIISGSGSLWPTRPGRNSRCTSQQPTSNVVTLRSPLPALVSSPPNTPTRKQSRRNHQSCHDHFQRSCLYIGAERHQQHAHCRGGRVPCQACHYSDGNHQANQHN